MSKAVNVMIVGEGASEQNFVDQVLAPYLAVKGIYLRATQISKKGEKGGDVKFSRARRDVINFLKQRENLIVSTFVDYYGVKEWPGLENVRGLHEPAPDVIAKVMNDAAVSDIRAEEIEWSRPIVLSRGVTMKRAKVSAPREIRYLAVRIDLKTPGLFLVGSDRAPDYGKPLAENSGLYAKHRDGTKKKIEPAVIRTRREPVREFMARAVKGEKEGGRGLDMALAFIASPTSLSCGVTRRSTGAQRLPSQTRSVTKVSIALPADFNVTVAWVGL